MRPVGDSYDNPPMENFWSTLKIELGYRNAWRTRDQADNAIFTYIDGWSGYGVILGCRRSV
jgi:transposase InsO family protein